MSLARRDGRQSFAALAYFAYGDLAGWAAQVAHAALQVKLRGMLDISPPKLFTIAAGGDYLAIHFSGSAVKRSRTYTGLSLVWRMSAHCF